MTTTAVLTVADLTAGSQYPNPLDSSRPPLTVARTEVTTSKKWMSEVPIIAIYFVNGPKAIKCVRVAADQTVIL